MNGLELAKKIRERDAKALFVFLTGFSHYVMDVLMLLHLIILQSQSMQTSWNLFYRRLYHI